MTDASTKRLQAAYDRFFAAFLVPFVAGEGIAQLGRPIAPGALEHFATAQAGSADAEARLLDALHRTASEIAPIDAVPWPCRDLVAMAIAIHDLLASTDPGLDRLGARGTRRVVLAWVDRLIDAIGPPTSRGDALARHALLLPLLGARRIDTVVRNWAYTYRFHGRPPPANVVALPRLRRVRQEKTTIGLLPALAGLDERLGLGLRARLRALVARSPITELTRPDRFAPLSFGIASLRVLSDRALRGGVAREIAGAGEWRAAPHLGAAIATPALRRNPTLLAPALRLLLEVQITVVLDARAAERLPDALDPDGALYAAILPAWIDDPSLCEELRLLDEGDRARLERRIELLRGRLGREPLRAAADLVSRIREVSVTSASAPSVEVSR